MNNKPMLLDPVCLKTLTAVEALPNVSNQHEFNGVAELKSIFGENKSRHLGKFSIRGSSVVDRVTVTWYDARERDPKRTEHRLYFQTNAVMSIASAGDNILIGLDTDGILNFILLK